MFKFVCGFCDVLLYFSFFIVFFFKQKTAYEMRISDWSSDVCSSDLGTAARLFYEAGAKVIAIQDHTGCLHNANGLNVLALLKHSEEHGGIAGAPEAENLTSAEFWALETELLIPAALEGQLNEHNANSIRAKIVIEGANGPTTPEADDILTSNGTLIVPDVLDRKSTRLNSSH